MREEREPSIHITEGRLKQILKEELGFSDKKLSPLVISILSASRKYSLSNRQILVSNNRQEKSVENLLKSDLQYNLLMAKTIYQVRKSKKHKGIDIAKPGSRDFTLIKTITKLGLEFHEEFEVGDIKTSFTTFITLCVERMKIFSLNTIPRLATQVMEAYDAMEEIRVNGNLEYTDRAYKCYNKHILNKIGNILVDYSKFPEKYQYFIKVALACRELKITPEIYIDAQFEGLKWANGIPDPTQLVGDNANKRLQTYLFENNVQLRDANKENNVKSVNALKSIIKNR